MVTSLRLYSCDFSNRLRHSQPQDWSQVAVLASGNLQALACFLDYSETHPGLLSFVVSNLHLIALEQVSYPCLGCMVVHSADDHVLSYLCRCTCGWKMVCNCGYHLRQVGRLCERELRDLR